MAIPAFQKVRQSSQDKTVLNNARQLSAASDQYFLENGVSSVISANLVGATNYVKVINTVAPRHILLVTLRGRRLQSMVSLARAPSPMRLNH